MSQGRVESDRDKLAVLTPPAQESLKAVLQEDERVLWVGKPVALAAWCDPMPGNITSRRVCAVLYIVTTGLALYVLVPLLVLLLAYIIDRLSGNFSLWDIVTLPVVAFLLLAALHFFAVVAFPWISISRARRRSYVLTSRQAITINESDQEVELLRQDLGDVAAPTVSRLRRDGVGNVIFDGYSVTQMTGDGGMDLTAHFDTGFTACPDAEAVAASFAAARLQRIPDREREDMEEMQRDYQGWLRRKGKL